MDAIGIESKDGQLGFKEEITNEFTEISKKAVSDLSRLITR